MGSRLRAIFVVLVLFGICGVLPSAAAAPREVTVVTHDLAPFVITKDGIKSGFSVDIWEEIAKRQQWTTRYIDVDDVKEQLAAVSDGQASVAMGAVSITAERSKQFDFSQPTLNAGLQIMVPAGGNSPSSPGLQSFLALLFSKTMLVWLTAALAITIIPAHLLWLIERRHADSMVSGSYFPGIFQAFGWGLGMLSASVDASPRHWFTRTLAILWAFVSIIFVAFYTANLTATLTVQKFDSKISGPGDLVGKKVCTVAGTTSENYLRSLGVPVSTEEQIGDCFAALRNKSFDAVVFDSPVLRYFVAHDGAGVGALAGPIFQAEDYGFAFRNGDELRKAADEALLKMRADGTYDLIKQKWFGNPNEGGS